MPRRSKDSEADMAHRFAEIYVYEKPGNITRSYELLSNEYGIEPKKSYHMLGTTAHRYFQKPIVKEAIEEERRKAQETADVRKDEIVGNLKRIAYDDGMPNRDRLQALKQLTDIGGFATQKVDLQAKADIEIVIE